MDPLQKVGERIKAHNARVKELEKQEAAEYRRMLPKKIITNIYRNRLPIAVFLISEAIFATLGLLYAFYDHSEPIWLWSVVLVFGLGGAVSLCLAGKYMENKPKSFQMTSIQPTDVGDRKWWQFTRMSRRELVRTAIIGVLAGGILSNSTDLLSSAFGTIGLLMAYVFGTLLSAMGGAAALLWLYKVIRRE